MKEVNHQHKDKVTIYNDFFDDSLREEIFKESKKHFVPKNLLFDDSHQVTDCIIDCHGLNMSNSRYFPYEVNCWNILSLKIKEYVVKYAERFGCDNIDIIPFACWGERFSKECSGYVDVGDYDEVFKSPEDLPELRTRYDSAKKSVDLKGQVQKHFIQSAYILHTTCPQAGMIAYLNDDEAKETVYGYRTVPSHLESPQNSLIIFDGNYRHTTIFPHNCHHEKYIISFTWYINKPFEVPDWILP